MRAFGLYIDSLNSLINRVEECSINESDFLKIDTALDGEPAQELRKLVPLPKLRKAGAFFTGSKLSKVALQFFIETFDEKSIILDPACGAGDLLIECARNLPQEKSLPFTLDNWAKKLMGRDIYPEFVHATKARLILTAFRKGAANTKIPAIEMTFPNIVNRSGLKDYVAFGKATHIVVNPPFSLVESPVECKWASGKVNSAALFLEACLLHAKSGARIVAILPDVLRSGTRYKKWRYLVESRSDIKRIELYGQFDKWADVDVFILELIVNPQRDNPVSWYKNGLDSVECVHDRFEVCVGPVVDYRDPHSGLSYPFIHARNLPPWQTMKEVSGSRRYNGKVISPPFVAVRRTSRKGDKYRSVGTIIDIDKPVAVENHLIVLTPKDGTVESCQKLVDNFQKPETSQWLDQYICCRHLTVSSLCNLPWWGDEQ